MSYAAMDKVNLQRLAKHIQYAIEAFLEINDDRIVPDQELRDFVSRFLPMLNVPIVLVPSGRDEHPSLTVISMLYDGRLLLTIMITRVQPDYLTITRGLIAEGI